MIPENTWKCTNCRCRNPDMVTVCVHCGMGRDDSTFWKHTVTILGMTLILTAVIVAACLYLRSIGA